MALTDWIQTGAIIYFAWQQNRIFKQQNDIFARQAGQAAMSSKASQMPWIGRYWPTVVMLGLMVLTGYDIYARHGAPPVIPWWFYLILLLILAVAVLVVGRLTTKAIRPPENPEVRQLRDEAQRLKLEKADLEAKYSLEDKEKNGYRNRLAMAEGKVDALQAALLVEKPKPPSKLVIHWANYRAVEGGGEEFHVGEFLRQIISGDSLVFDIENNNFVMGDKDFVPRDPFWGKEKRLQVNYSYAGSAPVTTERREHGRLLLPEDSKIYYLMGEVQRLNKLRSEENNNRLPLTALQVEAINLSSELLTFLKRMGPAPTPKYTAKQIDDMDSVQTKVLFNTQDGDFLDACAYHLGDKDYFGRTKQGSENEGEARMTRMLTWHRRLEAAYALELKDKVEGMRHRFIVEGVDADALMAPIPYKDSEKHIHSLAAKLWELAFKAGEKGNA